jgi:hypothetical protein
MHDPLHAAGFDHEAAVAIEPQRHAFDDAAVGIEAQAVGLPAQRGAFFPRARNVTRTFEHREQSVHRTEDAREHVLARDPWYEIGEVGGRRLDRSDRCVRRPPHVEPDPATDVGIRAGDTRGAQDSRRFPSFDVGVVRPTQVEPHAAPLFDPIGQCERSPKWYGPQRIGAHRDR